ncbi:hypothetical protein SAMN04488109_5328 [Chryseolinea serpens]|jgi:hypothetical protein|uniref:Metal binding domain of Ada n=2 Tax=Chryseolinea serpens TaxID=947013 RepID=A0A1M5VR92_9BACT|nr:hypothetical protein SAMN04488109_5328 [Chryseolinea serpens]
MYLSDAEAFERLRTRRIYDYLRMLKFYPQIMHHTVVQISGKHFVRITLWFLFLTAGTSSNAQSVFITRTGEKYHEGSCVHLHSSKIPITLSEALKRGYTPCHVCRPDRQVSPAADIPDHSDTKTDSTATEETTATQCTAMTKAGTRCKRAATSNGRCWQHQ